MSLRDRTCNRPYDYIHEIICTLSKSAVTTFPFASGSMMTKPRVKRHGALIMKLCDAKRIDVGLLHIP